MILLDANLLLYAVVEEMPEHDRAREWLERALGAGSRVGMPWASLLAFVRIASNPRVFQQAPSIADAWRIVETWLRHDAVWTPTTTERHPAVLARMLEVVDRSALVPDAHLAALAIEHGLTLFSCDRDFARFPGLHWENPLNTT